MSEIILETQRTNIRQMVPDDITGITQLFNMSKADAQDWINENNNQQKSKGYSEFSVFLKETGKYIGYCGCTEIELNGQPEVKLSWNLYKKYKEDDIDIEVAFAVRNYMFRYFDIHVLVALIDTHSPQDMNVAEEIDMENESTLQLENQKWLIYSVSRQSPKFMASFGDGESEPVLSSTQRRAENAPGFVRNLKRPKPRPT